ncbi:MAG TPA: DHA2 family efflux MFS transporter permease subunit [Streptosporangiaceae bacterium]|jgi:EmrB/QacA subfamily drug resistance transporter|nr:DHA2 family efflux MFS transporter permease subunit [Streptosporangiaceae bacterium]
MADNSARKWWALVAIAASVLVVGLDLTVLNLALPTIANDLHASTSDLQWFSDAYSLVLAAAMLPAGLLGDRFGRKKVLLVALLLFGGSSAACAYASSTGELIAARAVLGIGAAAIFPLSLSVIPVLFAPEERQKAIALMASATFISFPIGPIVGGYLLDHFWWGSVFLINVPVVVLALIAVAVLLPESRSAQRPSVDIVGVILSSAGLAGLTYGFIKAGQNGWTNVAALATIAAGVVVLAGFVAWERRITRRADGQPGGDGTRRIRPLVELRLFRSAGFTWGTALATLVSFAMFGIFFAMPQYFQEVRGVDAMGSGLRLLPMIGGMVVGMIGGTRMASPRKGTGDAGARAPLANAKALVTIGFTLMAATLAVGATTTVTSGTGFAAAWFAVFGLGLGLAMPQTMNAALSALSAERSGSGSALISALRQAGATIGVAVLGTVLDSVYRGHLAVTHLPAAAAATARNSVVAGVELAHTLRSAALLGSARSAFVAGLDAMLWACAGIALVSAVLALIFLPRRAEGTGGAALPGVGTTASPGAGAAAGESDSQRAQLEV